MVRSHRGGLVLGIFFCCLLSLRYQKGTQMADGFSPNNKINNRIAQHHHSTATRSSGLSKIRQRRRIRIRTSPLSSLKKNDYTSEISTAGTSAVASSSSLNPVEAWCTTHMNVWYDKSLAMKCPFFRRRMTDFLDGMDMVMRFLIIRHKSLPLIGPPPGCRSTIATSKKHKHLELNELMEIVRCDWKPNNNKGYYITGRLNTTIYRDDCWFEGPDPDMPVRGVRKYLNAASQLFDTATSTSELLSLEIIGNGSESKTKSTTIVAHWRLQGVLHLPWHPSLPVWTGRTTYHLDEEHMIYRHEEHWDISVVQAFTQTLLPEVGNVLWKTTAEEQEIKSIS